MSILKKTVLTTILGILTLATYTANAGVSAIPGVDQIGGASMGAISGDTTVEKLNNAGLNALSTVKVILNGLAVIFIVYSGVMMVVAYGDEGELTKQKNQLVYAIVAFLFVNIPGQIYNIFTAGREGGWRDVTGTPTNSDFTAVHSSGTNLFLNFDVWNTTIENGVLAFIRIGVIGLAIFMFTLAGFRLVVSGGSEDARKQARGQFLYGLLSLVFLGLIQGWVSVVYSGDIPKGQTIFASLANLALFFAGPTAIFFLTLGAWYYITSGGDDERAKKGKSIVVNTFVAVIILLASYTFLRDLADFKL